MFKRVLLSLVTMIFLCTAAFAQGVPVSGYDGGGNHLYRLCLAKQITPILIFDRNRDNSQDLPVGIVIDKDENAIKIVSQGSCLTMLPSDHPQSLSYGVPQAEYENQLELAVGYVLYNRIYTVQDDCSIYLKQNGQINQLVFNIGMSLFDQHLITAYRRYADLSDHYNGLYWYVSRRYPDDPEKELISLLLTNHVMTQNIAFSQMDEGNLIENVGSGIFYVPSQDFILVQSDTHYYIFQLYSSDESVAFDTMSLVTFSVCLGGTEIDDMVIYSLDVDDDRIYLQRMPTEQVRDYMTSFEDFRKSL